MLTIASNSSETTEQLGSLFASVIQPGSFIALYGDLGGGKTCFSRGVVATLAAENAHLVTSPTFAIMNEYHGKEITVYHFDLYRLHGSTDLYDLGFEDYCNGTGVCIVEWAERLGELLPPDALSIEFTYTGDTERILRFSASGINSGTQLKLFRQLLDNEKTFDPHTANLL